MRCLLPVVLCLGLAACGQKTVTGLYMARDAHGLVTVQIVETDDHHITGRAEFEFFAPNGEMTDRSDVATGAVADGTITLDLKPEALLEPTRSMSGSIVGGVLTLDGTGGRGHFHLVLKRTSQEAVQQAMKAFSGQAQARRQAIVNAKQRADDVRARDAFIQKTVETSLADDEFSEGLERVLGTLQRVEDASRTATTAMRTKLNRELAIVGDGQAAVARSQLYLAANQIGLESDEMHGNLEQGEHNFKEKVDGLERATIDQEQGCHSAHPSTTQNPVTPGLELWNTDCLLLFESGAKFNSAKAAMTKAFIHAEQVWSGEKSTQDQIDNEAQAATN